jgi:uncharacterized repeat protein (TIGR03987 family)
LKTRRLAGSTRAACSLEVRLSPLLQFAVVFMLAALTLYSIGVWSERFAHRLRPWHLAFFYGGLVCDAIGTDAMRRLVGGVHFNAHGITGAFALLLMAAHAVWATRVLVKNDQRAIATFHSISVFVWTVWLVPFVSGVAMA